MSEATRLSRHAQAVIPTMESHRPHSAATCRQFPARDAGYGMRDMAWAMLIIRQFERNDFDAVREIYQQGIDTKNATFETKTKDWVAWDEAMLRPCRLVAVKDEQVAGWAALSPVSSRRVYAGVAEVSVYVAQGARGQGVGSALLASLILESEKNGFWTLQAGIFPENQVSISVHAKHGFRVVGTREKLGHMGGKWRDVVLMERRSKVVGV